jgi:putative ABC transport system permease protein
MSSGKFLTKLAANSLAKRKLRSWLTMLGVIIGVAAIVTLMSVATGMNQNISSRLNTFGANIIQITPGGQRATNFGMGVPGAGAEGGSREFNPSLFGRETATLTETDESIVSQIEGVEYTSGTTSGRVSVTYKNKNSSISVLGIDPLTYWHVTTVNLSSGRLLTSSDTSAVLVGSRIYNQTFGEDLLNKYINIKGASFKVVGELNSSGQMFAQTDNTIIMLRSRAKTLTNQSTFNAILVAAKDGEDPTLVQDYITSALLSAHHVTSDKQDFSIQSQETIQATISQITGTLTLFLGGIGAIALLVGAIGVANTMFMSVLERTKEIGILKALGMTSADITTLFLLESAIIGLIGGVIGLLLSFCASFALSFFSINSVITIELAGGAVVFSVIIGIISGVAPARSAAALEPVQALAYE